MTEIADDCHKQAQNYCEDCVTGIDHIAQKLPHGRSVIGTRERNRGHGKVQEIAQWLPAFLHLESEDRNHKLEGVFLAAPLIQNRAKMSLSNY